MLLEFFDVLWCQSFTLNVTSKNDDFRSETNSVMHSSEFENVLVRLMCRLTDMTDSLLHTYCERHWRRKNNSFLLDLDIEIVVNIKNLLVYFFSLKIEKIGLAITVLSSAIMVAAHNSHHHDVRGPRGTAKSVRVGKWAVPYFYFVSKHVLGLHSILAGGDRERSTMLKSPGSLNHGGLAGTFPK